MIELTKLLIANPEFSKGLAVTVAFCVWIIAVSASKAFRNPR